MTIEKTPTRRNYLRAMLFQSPDWIPANVYVLPGTWLKYGEALSELMSAHPGLFPGYKAGSQNHLTLARCYRAGRFQDEWGVLWDNVQEGINAIPVNAEAPLRYWSAFEGYAPPDPLTQTRWLGETDTWERRRERVEASRASGDIPSGGLEHGFMFMRLHYLRGYSALMLDVAEREPRLDRLIAMVRDYNVSVVEKWLSLGVEMVTAGDDMGMQTALPMSPRDWRRYLKPAYRAIVGPCSGRGVYFYLHSDGHILEIIPDLAECGVNVINPQVRANGLGGLRRVAKGRLCINLDLDRQLFPFASRREIESHIAESIEALSSPRGGFMLTAECGPDVPLETIRAIIETLEAAGCGPM